MRVKTTTRMVVKAAAAISLAAGTAGLASVAAGSAAGSRTVSRTSVPAGPTYLHGHLCNVVATKSNRNVFGHAGQTVCAPKGRATLTAVGAGTVILIAGHGRQRLVASNDPNAHDVLIEGTGHDSLVVGTGGDDIVDEGTSPDSITCDGSGTVTVVDDNQGNDDSQGDDDSQGNQNDDSQGDNNNQGDCQGDGNVTSASQDWEGTITAPPTSSTITVTWTDANDGALTWLSTLGPPPLLNPVTFDISTATIEVDGGAPLAQGDQVEVASNPPPSGNVPIAVDVQVND
jgi:hypothetical protein